jgi:hypothetical protein
MDGMGCAPAVDRPSSGLGNEETRPVNLTASHDRKPMRQPQNMTFELFRPMA